jgi:hypothetical protein
MPLDTKMIEKLKAEHGEVYLLEAAGASVVVRPPSRAAMKRFFNLSSREDRRYEALEALLQDSAVYPEPAELARLLEKKPGLVAPFGEKLVALAGATEEAEFRPL